METATPIAPAATLPAPTEEGLDALLFDLRIVAALLHDGPRSGRRAPRAPRPG